MIDESFIKKICELSDTKIIEVEGRQYSSGTLQPVFKPRPNHIGVNTLEGFADYIEANIDGLRKEDLIIHILDFNRVDLFSKLTGDFPARDTYIVAGSAPLKFNFGNYYDIESFNISMQSQFIQDSETALILQIVGNVKEEAVRNFSDDGVTQEVTVKQGVSRVAAVPVPNPVTLRPFRTFFEVEQPASKFVFRMRSAKDGQPPACALFEADGGKWKQEAIENIARWLRIKITDISIIS